MPSWADSQRTTNGVVEFHIRGEPQDDEFAWLTLEQAATVGLQGGTVAPPAAKVDYGPRPSFDIWPAYEDWPPLRYETSVEAKAAGHTDVLGNVAPEQVVDTKKVFALQTAQRKADEAAAKQDEGNFPSSTKAASYAAQNRLEGYTPVRVQSTGKWQLKAPSAETADTSIPPDITNGPNAKATGRKVRRFRVRLAPTGSIDDQVLEAAISGDWEKAASFLSLKNAPSRWEVQQFAIQHAETPQELNTIYALAGYPPPLNEDGTVRFEPIFGTGKVPVVAQVPGETTAEMQASALQRYATQQKFGLNPLEAAATVGPGYKPALPEAQPSVFDPIGAGGGAFQPSLNDMTAAELAAGGTPYTRADPLATEWNTPKASLEATLFPPGGNPTAASQNEAAGVIYNKIVGMEQKGPDLNESPFAGAKVTERGTLDFTGGTGVVSPDMAPGFNRWLALLDAAYKASQPKAQAQAVPAFTTSLDFLARNRKQQPTPRPAFGTARLRSQRF